MGKLFLTLCQLFCIVYLLYIFCNYVLALCHSEIQNGHQPIWCLLCPQEIPCINMHDKYLYNTLHHQAVMSAPEFKCEGSLCKTVQRVLTT